jgi:hypothetical protein
MAFLYGSIALGDVGSAGKVEVVDVPAMTVLSLGSRGFDRPSRVEEMQARLSGWLRVNHEWELAGELRTMGYNSPTVRRDLRYFEVQIPIRPRHLASRLRSSI